MRTAIQMTIIACNFSFNTCKHNHLQCLCWLLLLAAVVVFVVAAVVVVVAAVVVVVVVVVVWLLCCCVVVVGAVVAVVVVVVVGVGGGGCCFVFLFSGIAFLSGSLLSLRPKAIVYRSLRSSVFV
jgi:hypothetical protein